MNRTPVSHLRQWTVATYLDRMTRRCLVPGARFAEPGYSGWQRHLAFFVCLNACLVIHAAPDDIAAPAAPNQAANQQFNNFEQAFNNIEANVFQQHGSAKQAKTSLETRLKLQVEDLNRVCELNDAQRLKLKLAASNDIRRFFEEFETLRRKYKEGKKDQQAWNNFWQEIQPLQAKLASGLFGTDSFYSKSVRIVLNPEQVAKYEVVTNDRRRYRYRASIEVVLDGLENTVPLRDEQRDAIVKLMMEQSKPPLAFGQHDYQVVMHNLTKVPESELKAVFNTRQWELLQVQLNQNRGWEQWLKQQGLIAKDEADGKKLKARVRRQIKRPDAAEGPADAASPANQGNE